MSTRGAGAHHPPSDGRINHWTGPYWPVLAFILLGWLCVVYYNPISALLHGYNDRGTATAYPPHELPASPGRGLRRVISHDQNDNSQLRASAVVEPAQMSAMNDLHLEQ